MKNYQKAEMIAKNLPTGSYAAGCPAHTPSGYGKALKPNGYGGMCGPYECSECEIAG